MKTTEKIQFFFPVEIEQDEDGIYIAECPLLQGCYADGKTKKEALKHIAEVITLCLEVRQELSQTVIQNIKKHTEELHGQPA
ncbi:MAG: type II toxin-antitoxin system HicB family antitoxin [Patescibacteria group bacterium]